MHHFDFEMKSYLKSHKQTTEDSSADNAQDHEYSKQENTRISEI